ncbi:MAG: hypothetical protein KAT68_11035 [Bacteroidales bacterium]|nr:hypothetical protein [Bacteroidales bacterium]
MTKKYISLLKKQIEKLDSKEFDLNSWKISTVLLLERIFGENSLKIQKIQDIKYDLGSWTLRDTLATSSTTDVCKKKGREIIEACILELETLGLPDKNDEGTTAQQISSEILINALTDELKGSQFKKLKEIINSRKKQEVKRKLIYDNLKDFGTDVSKNILATILSDTSFINKF